MKDVSPILRSLGLLDSEVKTYLAALERGPSPALDLAKHSKLSRQAIYMAIESLTERGLMSNFLRGKKRFYAAEEPGKLLAYAKRRDAEIRGLIADLERVVPELALRMGGERPVVRVFEGKEGLRAIIEDMKITKFQTSSEIADLDALYKVLSPDELKGMRLELKRRNVKIRGLYAGVPGPKIVETDRIYLPKELGGFKSDIGVYGNKIEMLTFEGKMYSVIIESAPLAKTLGLLLDLALRGAKDFPKG